MNDPALADLLSLVDDCDRLLALLEEEPRLSSGVRSAQERILRRFEDLGYRSVGEVGQRFDPEIHEAVSADPDAPSGKISAVYRRGWVDREGMLIYPASVVVGK